MLTKSAFATEELKEAVQHLFEIQAAAHGYLGPETQQELVRKLYVFLCFLPPTATQLSHPNLVSQPRKLPNSPANHPVYHRKSLTLTLQSISRHSAPDPSFPETNDKLPDLSSPDPILQTVHLPPEIIEYVDNARNPDIYTREFVELVQRGNQDLKGKAEAFASFRDVLAREMASAMPECKKEV